MTPVDTDRHLPCFQCIFLRIQPVLHIAAFHAVNEIHRGFRCRDRGGMQHDFDIRIVQLRMEIIHRLRTRTDHTQIGSDRRWFAEKLQCLVNQMRTQVIPDTAA